MFSSTEMPKQEYLTDLINRLNNQSSDLLDFSEEGDKPLPEVLHHFMLNTSEAADLLSLIRSLQFGDDQTKVEPQTGSTPNQSAESAQTAPPQPVPELTTQEFCEKWQLILDLVNRPEYRAFREVSTFEAFRKLYPEMLEREILVGDVTECVCAAMDRANLTCKQLADKVGWSRKKLKRVLSGDITVKQVARLLFACGCRAKILVEEQHEITT